MGSSKVRRVLRALWSRRHNLTTSRRIVPAPVWGVISVSERAKATEGAERSLRKRKSRRGLRRGRRRSREGKTRSPSPLPATVDKEHVARKVRRLLRQFAYWDRIFLSFENALKKAIQDVRARPHKARGNARFNDPLVCIGNTNRWGGGGQLCWSPFALWWRGRYDRLRRSSRVTCKSYIPMGWLVFLDSRLGYSFPGELNEASSVLEELALRAGEAALAHRMANQTVHAEVSNTPSVVLPTQARLNNRSGERKHPQPSGTSGSQGTGRYGKQLPVRKAKVNPKVDKPKYPPSPDRDFRSLF